jgi:hypothetical protein
VKYEIKVKQYRLEKGKNWGIGTLLVSPSGMVETPRLAGEE